MVKNWLIRTKSNHILGPVSRDKVLELQQNGSIRSDDELCRGNGYWFYLRETELLNRFLIEDEPQPFNPICEAPDVFRDAPPTSPIQFNDDITLFTTLPARDEVAPPPPPPPGGSGMVGRKPAVEPSRRDEVQASVAPPSAPGKVSRRRETPPVRPLPVAPLPQRRVSDKVIMGAAIGALLVLAVILYYRKRLISEFAHAATSVIVPAAVAQDDVKKKVSLTP